MTNLKKPEELASYVSSKCESWTERVAAGKAGSNDPDIVSEFQAIVDKHVSTLKKDGYVKFHRALTKEVCQTLRLMSMQHSHHNIISRR